MTLTELLATPPYDVMSDADAAAAINAATAQVVQPLSTRDLLRWGFGRVGLSKLKDAADRAVDYTGISEANRARALSAYAVITQGIEGELDITEPEIDGMLDLLVSTGIFVAQDKADLITRATKTIPLWTTLTRIDPYGNEVLLGEPPTVGHVEAARL